MGWLVERRLRKEQSRLVNPQNVDATICTLKLRLGHPVQDIAPAYASRANMRKLFGVATWDGFQQVAEPQDGMTQAVTRRDDYLWLKREREREGEFFGILYGKKTVTFTELPDSSYKVTWSVETGKHIQSMEYIFTDASPQIRTVRVTGSFASSAN